MWHSTPPAGAGPCGLRLRTARPADCATRPADTAGEPTPPARAKCPAVRGATTGPWSASACGDPRALLLFYTTNPQCVKSDIALDCRPWSQSQCRGQLLLSLDVDGLELSLLLTVACPVKELPYGTGHSFPCVGLRRGIPPPRVSVQLCPKHLGLANPVEIAVQRRCRESASR